MSQTTGAAGSVKGSRDAVRAWVAVACTPGLLVLGFVLGSALLGDPNEPTSPHGLDGAGRVLLLWVVLEVAPALGIFWAARGARRGERGSRWALAANALVFVFFVAVTLVGGLLDTLK